MHLFISCRPLLDAEKRLHEAAKNGKCDEIKALAADGTDMNCPGPDYVRISSTCRPALENDHNAARDVDGNFSTVIAMLEAYCINATHRFYGNSPRFHRRLVAMLAEADVHIMCRI